MVGLLLIFQRDIRVAYHERRFVSTQEKYSDQAYGSNEDRVYLAELMEYHCRSLVDLGVLVKDEIELKLGAGEGGAWLNDDLNEFMKGEDIISTSWSRRPGSAVLVEAWYPPGKQGDWEALKRKWVGRLKKGMRRLRLRSEGVGGSPMVVVSVMLLY